MTRDDLWQQFCDRNPSFADPSATVTLTARGLRKLFDLTWDTAYKAGGAGRLDQFNPLKDLFGMK